jgi:hypothetical protein
VVGPCRSLLVLGGCPLELRGLPKTGVLCGSSRTTRGNTLILVSPSKRLHCAGTRLQQAGCSSLPLLGFVESPLRRTAVATVHSRGTEAPLRSRAATREITFRPRGFSPPRRFTPVAASDVLQSVTAMGFATFPDLRSVHPANRTYGPRDPSPQHDSYPSKNSPRQQPHRITAAVAFLPLPRAPHARTSRASCVATPRCRHAPRASSRHPPGKPDGHAP